MVRPQRSNSLTSPISIIMTRVSMPPSKISTHANEWGQIRRQEGVLDILKIDKNSTDLLFHVFHVSLLGCLELCLDDKPSKPLVATGLRGAPQKCFQSGPALAKAGPGQHTVQKSFCCFRCGMFFNRSCSLTLCEKQFFVFLLGWIISQMLFSLFPARSSSCCTYRK